MRQQGIAIIDNRRRVRSRLQGLIANCEEFSLTLAAAHGEQTYARLAKNGPRLLLVGPTRDGRVPNEAIVRARLARVAPVLIAEPRDGELLLAALERGTRGCVLHTDPDDAILQAIDHALNGSVPLDPRIATGLVNALSRSGDRAPVKPCTQGEALTPTECRVLELLAHGNTYQETARYLGISAHTVSSHIKNIYRSLDVHSAAAAVFRAVQAGWIRVDPDTQLTAAR